MDKNSLSGPKNHFSAANNTSQPNRNTHNTHRDNPNLIAAQKSIQASIIILLNLEAHTESSKDRDMLTKQIEEEHKELSEFYTKEIQKIEQKLDEASWNPSLEEFWCLKEEAHNLLKSLQDTPSVLQLFIDLGKSVLYSDLPQSTDISPKKDKLSCVYPQIQEQANSAFKPLKLTMNDMLKRVEWSCSGAPPTLAKNTESTDALEEENKEEGHMYLNSSNSSNHPLTEDSFPRQGQGIDFDSSTQSSTPPSINAPDRIGPFSAQNPSLGQTTDWSSGSENETETVGPDRRDQDQKNLEINLDLTEEICKIGTTGVEGISPFLPEWWESIGALRLDNVPDKNYELREIFATRFPDNVLGLYFNANSDSLKSIDFYIDELISMGAKAQHRMFVYNYAISQKNFQKIMGAMKDKERVGFPFCKMDFYTAPNLKNILKGTKIIQISFKGCGISTRCNWRKNPHHFVDLIQGLATSEDLQKSLKTIWLPKSYLDLKTVRQALNNNGFGEVKIGQDLL